MRSKVNKWDPLGSGIIDNRWTERDDAIPPLDDGYVNIVTSSHSAGLIQDPEAFALWEQNVFILTKVIIATRNEVLFGIGDAGHGAWPKTGLRADALYWFVSGGYWAVLQYCGIESKRLPKGLDTIFPLIADRCRRMPRCPVWKDDNEVVRWCYEDGQLGDDEIWDAVDKRVQGWKLAKGLVDGE